MAAGPLVKMPTTNSWASATTTPVKQSPQENLGQRGTLRPTVLSLEESAATRPVEKSSSPGGVSGDAGSNGAWHPSSPAVLSKPPPAPTRGLL